MKYVLYNPHSGNGQSKIRAEEIAGADATLIDMTEIDSYADFFAGVAGDDSVIICGGDGTLNRFLNDTGSLDMSCELLYVPTGTGNDFAVDVGMADMSEAFSLAGYVENLPTVNVDGEDYRFINGVGYGIDGYCCEVGDKT